MNRRLFPYLSIEDTSDDECVCGHSMDGKCHCCDKKVLSDEDEEEY